MAHGQQKYCRCCKNAWQYCQVDVIVEEGLYSCFLVHKNANVQNPKIIGVFCSIYLLYPVMKSEAYDLL